MSSSSSADPIAATQTTSKGALQSTQPTIHPQSVSIPLPHILHTNLHVKLTRLETSNIVFLTTTDPSSSSSLSALGSFVYSIPSRFQPADPLCTALYAVTGTVDFATRVAKIMAKRTGKPAYVGCSAVFPAADMEEEMGALRAAIDAVMGMLAKDEGK